MTADAEAEKAAHPHPRLRIALIVLAAIVAIGALRDIPGIFYEFNPTTPLGKLAQTLTSVDLVLAVPITLAALYFAVAGHVRYAIAALAVRQLVDWVCDTPTSIAIHGIEWSPTYGGINVLWLQAGVPLVALARFISLAATSGFRSRRSSSHCRQSLPGSASLPLPSA